MRILLIDNYDSFTYNLVDYFEDLKCNVIVFRNNEIPEKYFTLEGLKKIDAIVISPGPGEPQNAGDLMKFISATIELKPYLGVCLGMQAIALHFQHFVKKARLPMHGKISQMSLIDSPIFENITNPMEIGRYHSLVIEMNESIPQNLLVLGHCKGEIMAIQHQKLPIFAVQFHPESILTKDGKQFLKNWIQFVYSRINFNNLNSDQK